MGWITILFLVFGWIFSIKGLIIAALVVSAVFIFLTVIGICACSGETKQRAITGFVEQSAVLTLSIVKLNIGF